MFHMDQVPLPFSPGSKRTLHMKGEQCVIREPGGSGATKRFCTLQVTICAQADQQCVKMEIIFRGGGERLSDEELATYAALKNVTVRFQQKAWSDTGVTLDYMEDFRAQTLQRGEVLLGMDNHGAQRVPAVLKFMELMSIIPAYTPANCTDCTSPVDRHVGQAIKLKIAKRYHECYDKNRLAWELPKKHGGLSDSTKRQLVAGWASEAWAEMCENNQDCITAAFVKTGFLLAKDGSENGKVELWPRQKGEYSSVGPNGEKYDF